MLNWLSIYGNYKMQRSNDNRGAGKYVLGLLGIAMVGYFIIKGIVDATGFNNLYGIVGSILWGGFKLVAALFILGYLALWGMAILQWVFGVIMVIDDWIRGTNKKDNKRLKNNF